MSERFTQQQVDARNAKTAAQHNANEGVGHHEFRSYGPSNFKASPADSYSLHPVTPINFVISASTDEQKLNKTEKAYLCELRRLGSPWVGIQNITLKLGDDCRFTPDFSYISVNGELVFVDVKGFCRDDALVKLKTAARQYPLFRFVIIKKTKCGWEETQIKP